MLDEELADAVGGLGNLMQPVGRERRRRTPAAQPVQADPVLYDWRGEGLVTNAADVAGRMHRRQGQQLSDAAGQIMDAMADENSRRAAMAREMRRMEHERRMEMMRQETERMKIDALLKRLDDSNGVRAGDGIRSIRLG